MGLTEEEISNLESVLGTRFPKEIREAYSKENGLRGPTDITLLWSATEDSEGIVASNRLFKDSGTFPLRPRDVTFFGDEGTGGVLFFHNKTHRAGVWHAADGEETHTLENSVGELWATIIRLYDDALSELDAE